MGYWGSEGRVGDELEVAGALPVVQGACLFSEAPRGQYCPLFLSIYVQLCSSEIFLAGYLQLRCAEIGPFDLVCLIDYARYQ